MAKPIIIDSILAADLQDRINLNPDYEFESPELKEKIFSFAGDELIRYKTELGSIKILAADPITEDSIEKELEALV